MSEQTNSGGQGSLLFCSQSWLKHLTVSQRPTKEEKEEGRFKNGQHFFTQALPCCASHFPYNILSCIKDIYLIAVTELWEKAF